MSNNIPDDLLISIAKGEPVATDSLQQFKSHIDSIGTAIGRTLLMAAAFGNKPELIRWLVSNGASVDYPGGFYGLTALHEAAMHGHLDAINTLLELGADIEQDSDDGSTPLLFASALGECGAIKLLLSKGADLNHANHHGQNAWMCAVDKCEDEAAAILKAAGSFTWD